MGNNIKFDELARFGLELFRLEVTLTKTDGGDLGYKIDTHPVRFEGIIEQAHGLLPGGMIENAKFASAAMSSDGTLIVHGFHDQARPRLAEMLRKGRDDYFDGLNRMYDDKPRKNIAGDVADAVLTGGINPDDIKIELACGHCGNEIDAVGGLLSKVGMITEGKMALVPASWTSLTNGDFRALFDQRVRDSFPAMVKEQLRAKLPKAREMRDQISRGIELASKLVGE